MENLKANELRIGNYVDLYGSITTIHRVDFAECKCSHGIAVDSGKPIPLTEEWLVKFGFKELKGKFGIGKRFAIGINPRTEDYILILEQVDKNKQDFFYQSSFFSINHVHKLQNLYFALTGKELNDLQSQSG